MICYNCKSQIPDNTRTCNYCGATFYNLQPHPGLGYTNPAQPSYSNPPYQSTYSNSPYQPVYTNQPGNTKPKKKFNIFIPIVAVLYSVLIGLIILLVYRNNYNDTKQDLSLQLDTFAQEFVASMAEGIDGTYALESCTTLGMTYSVEELEAMTGDSFDMTLTIHKDVCTLNAEAMGFSNGSCAITVDGDQITLIDGTEVLTGTYDEVEQSITITSYGIDMKFVKE